MSRQKKPARRMARFKRGQLSCWNYRGYCVQERPPGDAGPRWISADEEGGWRWSFRTLADFRRAVDRWERARERAAK
jgi:hypothetical protein